MSTSTNALLIKCPRCNVQRIELKVGQWCVTCGYNPDYEERINELLRALEPDNSEDKDNELSSWFAGICRACGYKVIITQPDSERCPGNDYWWYCSNKKCRYHEHGTHTGDMERPEWTKKNSKPLAESD